MTQSPLYQKKSQEKPNAFLDHIIRTLALRNDAALARRLEMTNPAICRVRNGGPISDEMMLRVHEESPEHLPIYKLQELRGGAVSSHARTTPKRLLQQPQA